jgi:hypothetical protein
MKISSITPVKYFYKEDGGLFRDLDRLKSHILSLKRQKGIAKKFNLEIYIADSSSNSLISNRIKKICKNNGAKYLKQNRNDFFNRGLLINDAFKAIPICDEILLLDLDLILNENLISRFISARKVLEFRVLICGINFLSIYEIDLKNKKIDESLLEYQIESQKKRFFSANGLQFIKYNTFSKFGGLDVNFNAYCGTDDEILCRANKYKISKDIKRSNFCINKSDDPLAYHLNHSIGTFSIDDNSKKKEDYLRTLLCETNREYLSEHIYDGKFRFQNNLKKDLNYICRTEDDFYWGNENMVKFDFKGINKERLIKEYLENRSLI